MIVGLTGGIACGKTFCTDYLSSNFGIRITDADYVARQVVMPGTKALSEIVELFGCEILQSDGFLNRRKMREIIFSDENARHILNTIVHPRIRDVLLEELQSGFQDDLAYQVLSAPLLIENHLQEYVDCIVVIDIAEPIQIQRLQARDTISQSMARSIIETQLSRHERLRHANFIISNSGNPAKTFCQIDSLHNLLSQIRKYN